MNGPQLFHALAELHADEEGKAPPMIHLCPAGDAGGTVIGRDGRAFRPDFSAIVAAFNASAAAGQYLCLDWEHGTESRWMQDPQRGGRAAGWITKLSLSDAGALQGEVEWTPMGAEDVTAKYYRYISPAIYADEYGRAYQLSSAALTNRPNLTMPAVHREQEPTMQKIAQALGLDPTTTEDKIVEALHARLTTAVRPDPEKWTPRTDYLHAMERATKAESALAKVETDRRAAELNSLIEGAVADGKFAPASVELHRETYSALPDGVERLRKLIAATPKALHSTPQTPAGSPPATNGQPADPLLHRLAKAARVKVEDLEKTSAPT